MRGHLLRSWLLRDVVLCDLDSTLFITEHRHHLAPTRDSSRTWSDYAKACVRDELIAGTAAALRMLYPRRQVHLISGRDGSALVETRSCLASFGVPYDRLTLRPLGIEDSNADLKVSYVRKLRAEGLNPVLLLDDWPDTVAAVEREGVPTIRVGNSYATPEPDGYTTK